MASSRDGSFGGLDAIVHSFLLSKMGKLKLSLHSNIKAKMDADCQTEIKTQIRIELDLSDVSSRELNQQDIAIWGLHYIKFTCSEILVVILFPWRVNKVESHYFHCGHRDRLLTDIVHQELMDKTGRDICGVRMILDRVVNTQHGSIHIKMLEELRIEERKLREFLD